MSRISRKKIVTVYFPVHIYRFVLREEKWLEDGVLNLSNAVFPVYNRDTDNVKKSLAKRKKRIPVKVLMESSSHRHQYSMVQYFEKCFARRMVEYVDVRRDLYGPWAPLREFLKMYEITLDEYDFDTAYKRYNREYKRKQEQNQKLNERNSAA